MGFELKPGGTTIHRAALPPFITVRELQELLRTSKTLRMIDSRAERAYDRGHLSQAVNLPARDLNPLRSGVRSLIAADRLEHKLSHLGIGREPAVIYGAKGGADAAHVWWTLHAYAHPEVYLLDGGIEAWMEAGLPLVTETETPPATQSPFTPTFDPLTEIELDELLERLEDPNLVLLDTRSPEEYRGEDVAAKRGGHVPGAQLLPWDELLGSDLCLRGTDWLRQHLEPILEAGEVATYCQSGVRAAHTYAVLKALGHPRPRLYLASWTEWGNLDETPIITGNS